MSEPTFHRPADTLLGISFGGAAVALLMVFPVLAIGYGAAGAGGEVVSPVATSATAALGVFFRAGARNVLRGTMLTTVRATSRTVTRRFARRGIQVLALMLVPDTVGALLGRGGGSSAGAVITGILATALSFGGVLWIRQPGIGDPLLLSVLAVAPLAVHFGLVAVLARPFGLVARFATSLDGLLLQAYFTIAGSFLPLASDADLEGPAGARAWVSAAVLGTLATFAIGLALVPGTLASQMSSLFLVYAFVYAFPLDPLPGGQIFAASRAGWLGAFFGVVVLFGVLLPEAWYVLL
ncbi:MAG: hypothetical protein KC656_20920 [Myxococcales bacterium]|nr:hypothetical protein [Myxococcales bacterium]